MALSRSATHVNRVFLSAIVDAVILKLTLTVINTKEQFLQVHLGGDQQFFFLA
jgi:hypothetical protein